jgi:hypothetical protein
VAAYRLALEEQTRDRIPLGWAVTQNGLGDALRRLGDREHDPARLEEAVVAYNSAIGIYTDYGMHHKITVCRGSRDEAKALLLAQRR